MNLTITTACPLRCRYCFIQKDSGPDLDPGDAEGAVRMFLGSPGRRKGLKIYGGEPLSRFALLSAVARSAKREARRLEKDLFLGVCSNGVLLDEQKLEFLAREGIHLSLSLSGSKGSHDRSRVTGTGAGSFDRIARRLPAAFRILGPRRLVALMCVDPAAAGSAFDDFKELAGMGFEVINVEVVHGFEWDDQALAAFGEALERISEHVLAEAGRGRLIFAEPFLRYIRGEDTAFEVCPLHSSLCVFPDGSYSLYPHPFLDPRAIDRKTIGHARRGLEGRFGACGFDAASQECRSCASRYYDPAPLSYGVSAFRQRCRAFKRLARDVVAGAGTDPALRAYLKEGLRRVLSYQA